jgi:hypothetical protein
MTRLRLTRLTGLLAFTLLLSCTDGQSLLQSGAQLEATLTVAPVLPAAASSAAAEPVTSVRVSVLDPNTLIPIQDPTGQGVDPNASQWRLDIRIPLGDQTSRSVVLDIELVSAAGSVEWAARVGPVSVTLGLPADVQVQSAQLGRGPLGNLAVSSLQISGPASVLVGESFSLSAMTETVDGSTPQVFWTSLTPGIAEIDDQGNGVGLVAGRAEIEARSGLFGQVWWVEVRDEPLPDLVPSGLSVTPSQPTSEESVDIDGTIRNEGDLAASSIGWQILVDGSAVASGTVSSLSPGSSASVGASGVGPFDVGDRTVQLVVDGGMSIRESNDSNNTASTTFTVVPPPAPDLVVTSISFSPENPTSAEQVTVTIVIENQGSLGAVEVLWKMFLDGSLAYVTDPPESFIGPGSSITRSLTGGPLSAGDHTFEFFVDADESIAESNEDNNTLSRTLTVTQAAFTTGGLTGRVISGLDGTPKVGADVQFSGPSSGSLSTDSNGLYLIEGLEPGTYDVEVSFSGYVTARYIAAVVVAGPPQTLETLVLVPDVGSPGVATGTILDASTGSPIPGATLEVRPGVNALGGSPVQSGSTDSSGGYIFSGLSPGQYTLWAAASGYAASSRAITVLGGETVAGQDLPLSSTSGGSETLVRVILTWGADPDDLDAHLTGPNSDGSTRFHVWWTNPGTLGAEPFAALDVDDVFEFGPETITFESDREGLFRYYVHDWTNSESTSSSALSNSSARVEVFRGSSLLRSFNVPSGLGTLWEVFHFEDGEITDVNALSFRGPDDVGALPASGNGPEGWVMLSDLPVSRKKGGR